jgi:hypothetical protein
MLGKATRDEDQIVHNHSESRVNAVSSDNH